MERRSSRVHLPTRQSLSRPKPRTLSPNRHRCPLRQMARTPCSCLLHRPCRHVSLLPLAEPQPLFEERGPLLSSPEPDRSNSHFVAWRLASTTVISLPGDYPVQQSNTEILQKKGARKKNKVGKFGNVSDQFSIRTQQIRDQLCIFAMPTKCAAVPSVQSFMPFKCPVNVRPRPHNGSAK